MLKNSKVGYFLFFCSLIGSCGMSILSADTSYRVQNSDNLNRIVGVFYKDSTLTKTQILLGIFEKNPSAFKSGNINSLLSGAILTLPDEDKLLVYQADEAKEVLKEYLKGGINDSDFSLSDLVKSIQNQEVKESTKKITADQKKQSAKIDKLKKEGDDLRKQLEQLVSEKSFRDQQLANLEKTIKNSLEATKQSPQKQEIVPSNENKKGSKELAEQNQMLQKKLQKSRSELAEKSTSNVSLERQLNYLQKQSNNNGVVINSSEPTPSTNTDVLKSKLLWLVPLLLGIWYFLNRLMSRNKKMPQSSFNDQSSSTDTMIEENESIDLNYQEKSIEESIKLDIAKAYIDMKNIDPALTMLEEVVEKGDEELRREAKRLIESV